MAGRGSQSEKIISIAIERMAMEMPQPLRGRELMMGNQLTIQQTDKIPEGLRSFSIAILSMAIEKSLFSACSVSRAIPTGRKSGR
jgi:hypothetical protein